MECVLIRGTVVITGASGQVGGACVKLFRERFAGSTVLAPGRDEMDLRDPASIRGYLQKKEPRWIVSSAAYTAVDAAETDRDGAWAVNAVAPEVVAREARRMGATMIHLSTDYVFPGTGKRPWVETDATGPLNVYGASKLAGEEAIAASGAEHVILRTSWVYSASGKNFVRTMLRLLTTRDTPLRVVADQHGAPTSADDLADTILRVVERCETGDCSRGVYHCAGGGETTWAGLAEAVRSYLVEECGKAAPEIVPVPGSEYPTPAVRPANSRLCCDKLSRAFDIALPRWETSLRKILTALAATDLPHGV